MAGSSANGDFWEYWRRRLPVLVALIGMLGGCLGVTYRYEIWQIPWVTKSEAKAAHDAIKEKLDNIRWVQEKERAVSDKNHKELLEAIRGKRPLVEGE